MSSNPAFLLIRIVTFVALALAATFAAGVLWYQAPTHAVGRGILIAAWLLFAIACAADSYRRRDWRALAVFALPFAAIVAWFATIEPRNDRIWSPGDGAHAHLRPRRR